MGIVGEVAIVPSIQVNRSVGAFSGQHRNDTVTLVKRTKLFCSANFGGVRARTQQRQRYLTRIDLALYRGAPDGRAGDALGVDPRVQAFLREVGLQALGQQGSVLPGVRDENAQWFRRGHRLRVHYEGGTHHRQSNSKTDSATAGSSSDGRSGFKYDLIPHRTIAANCLSRRSLTWDRTNAASRNL